MNNGTTGKIIKELRKEKNLSQRQLAEMIPISRQAVSKWERNERIPDASSLLRLSSIFDVTINELLIGKRIEKPSIKELENVTLELIDVSNKKIDKSNNRFLITLIISCLLLILFLSYYFFNSYNSIQVYKISSNGNNFYTTSGLFIITREKTYLKIGNLDFKEDCTINNIKLLYKKNGKNIIIFNDKDINQEIMNIYGSEDYFKSSDIKYIINESYLIINYNDNEEETIKLYFERDFINKSLLFNKRKKVIDLNNNTNDLELIHINKEKLISVIKNKWVKRNNSYSLSNDNEKIEIIYFEDQKQLSYYKNNKSMWHYDLTIDNIICTEEKRCENKALQEIKNILNE